MIRVWKKFAFCAVLAITLTSCGGGDDASEAGQSSGPLAAAAREREDAALEAATLSKSVPSAPGAAQIVFAGHTFQVREGAGGPGPNTWSRQNVWVDARGQLHLKIANRAGQWSSAEIYTNERLGFGKYSWRVAGNPGALDDNVVLGFFNYPTEDVGPDRTNEIDIEFATWGGVQPQHGNWTVWPAVAGYEPTSYAFDPVVKGAATTYQFEWAADRVIYGMGANPAHMDLSWKFRPEAASTLVPQRALPLHMNLWLFEGRLPTDGKEVEIVITGFDFKAAKQKRR